MDLQKTHKTKFRRSQQRAAIRSLRSVVRRQDLTRPVFKSRFADEIEQRKTAMTVKELAVLLAVDPEWVYRAIRRGQLRAIRHSPTSGIRLEPKEVADFLRWMQGLPIPGAA